MPAGIRLSSKAEYIPKRCYETPSSIISFLDSFVKPILTAFGLR